MRVACPNCAAEYNLPPAIAARLEEGRTVRCARCGITWSPAATGALATTSPEPVPPPAPAPRPVPVPAEPARPVPVPAEPARPVPVPMEPARTLVPEPSVAIPPLPPAVQADFTGDDLSDAPIITSRLAPERPAPALAPRAASARRTGLAWAASLLLLLAALGAAWYWRIDIVEAWPPAARAYMALGLAG